MCRPGSSAADPWWNEGWKCRRKVTVYFRKTQLPGDEVCYVEFPTGGYLRPDGGDLRVISGKEDVPFKPVFVGPGDYCKLAFRLSKGLAGARTFHVYYGNPKAEPPKRSWEPRRGVLLETRKYEGGAWHSWDMFKDILDLSAKSVHGRGYVNQIFDSFNPFGPSSGCVKIYTGWLNVSNGGQYRIATTSGGASYVLFDGKPKPVVSKNNPRRVRRAVYNKPVKLTRGLHRIEYYSVHTRTDCSSVAAWALPGTKRYQAIPKEAFAGVVKGSCTNYEIHGSSVAPDFAAKNVGDTLLQGRIMARLRFEDKTCPRRVGGPPPKWDFGDGAAGTGKKVEHVYLAPGMYEVTMTVDREGAEHKVQQAVSVSEAWERQLKPSTDEPRQYYATVADYPFHKMEVPSLLVALDLCHELQKPDDIIKVGRVLFKKKLEVPDQTILGKARMFANALCEKEHYREAVTAFHLAEKAAKAAATKLELALGAGEVQLRARDHNRALVEFDRAMVAYGNTNQVLARKIHVKLGDAYRRKPDFEKSLAEYEKALSIPISKEPFRRQVVRVGALSRAAEHYIRANELDTAEDKIVQWEWTYPPEKLTGYCTFLKAQCLIKREKLDEAIAELEELVAVNPKSGYAADALALAADCYVEKNLFSKAKAALETIVVEYRDSPIATKAVQKLSEIEEERKKAKAPRKKNRTKRRRKGR